MTTCDCCHDAEAIEGDLCSQCAERGAIIRNLAPSYKLHVLAAALDHSAKDICHIIGCTASAHYSALGNATRASGLTREQLIKTAKYGLKTGRFERPAGFEDLGPENGPEPIGAHTHGMSGTVPVSSPTERQLDTQAHREARAAAQEAAEAEPETVEQPDVRTSRQSFTEAAPVESFSAYVDLTPEPEDPRLETEYYRGLVHGLLRGIEALERVR